MSKMNNARFRLYILERDGYKCCACGFESFDGKNLDVHHNDKRQDIKRTYDPDNCILVCSKCHANLHAAYPDYVPPPTMRRIIQLRRDAVRSIKAMNGIGGMVYVERYDITRQIDALLKSIYVLCREKKKKMDEKKIVP
jgi:hypothetical protein